MYPLIFSTIKDAHDRSFMEQLYEQYHKLMYSQVSKLTKDEFDVEEIVQETLIRLIKKVEFLQTLPRDRLINYIISVTRYTGYAYFRKKAQIELIPFEDYTITEHSHQALDYRLDEIIIRRIEEEKLYYVWTHLKAQDQALLNMKYIWKRQKALYLRFPDGKNKWCR